MVPSFSVVTFVEAGQRLNVGIVERVTFLRSELRSSSVTVKRDCCCKFEGRKREVLP